LKFAEIQSLSADEKPQEGRLGFFNMLLRRRVNRAVESLGVVLPGDAITEWKKRGNVFALSPGEHGGNILTKPDTEIHALGPGAFITKPLEITADAVIDGVTMMPPVSSGSLVTVRRQATAVTVVFRSCTFEQPADETAAHVTVESSAKVVLIGCIFRGGGTTATPVVDHPIGPATDVQVAFCYNNTGNTLGLGADVTLTGNV